MNIYFSGIGGVGLGPLAEIAQDAGHDVAGSDSSTGLMTEELSIRRIVVSNDQSGAHLRKTHDAKPIDWLVYTAALPDDHPELIAARELGIKTSKRDELLLHILKEKNLKLIAVAGTHGKTTTTGMIVWLARYFGVPVSYCIGTTLSWAPSGGYVRGSEYFVYECDEFDRNFLQFHPEIAIITSIEHDHPDTYPTESDYFDAFKTFASQAGHVVTWSDFKAILSELPQATFINESHPALTLKGEHNRKNAGLILAALEQFGLNPRYAADGLNKFPGTSRRFEWLDRNLYTDYGHTPTEIKATLQLAREISDDVVLVYQPHQNIRQHEIRDQYSDDTFADAKKIFWLPTYLSREDSSLDILSPEQLTNELSCDITISDLNDELWSAISKARDENKLVLCMGAGSIDDWVRAQLT